MPLLGNVFAQITIEYPVAAGLQAAKRLGRVGLDVKSMLDGLVILKLLYVVNRQSIQP